MVFYFSGTGNSLWVARSMAEAFSDKLVAMGDYFARHTAKQPIFSLAEGERVGFVSPVHSWGVPPLVKNFICNVRFENATNPFIYAIFTCGDEAGYTRTQFLDLLKSRGWHSRHVYSVQMPNNYIVFPGFDVDSQTLQEQKKQAAKTLLPPLIQAIADDAPIDCYKTGSLPFLKSKIIYPMFCKYALNPKPFYPTDLCTGCGACVQCCPTKNIVMVEGKPLWGANCTQCLSCIHRCPQRAIEYGKMTQKKGRYKYK